MFCKNCGNQVSESAKFCTKCGYKKTSSVSVDESKKPSRLLRSTITFLVEMVILSLAIYWMALSNWSEKYGVQPITGFIMFGLIVVYLVILIFNIKTLISVIKKLKNLPANIKKITAYTTQYPVKAGLISAVFLAFLATAVFLMSYGSNRLSEKYTADVLPIIQDSLSEVAAAKLAGDALAANQKIIPASFNWQKVQNVANNVATILDDLQSNYRLSEYKKAGIAWAEKISDAAKDQKNWKDVPEAPADFTIILKGKEAKKLFNESLDKIEELIRFGNYAIERNDKETMRYVNARLLVQKHWLQNLIQYQNSGIFASLSESVYAAEDLCALETKNKGECYQKRWQEIYDQLSSAEREFVGRMVILDQLSLLPQNAGGPSFPTLVEIYKFAEDVKKLNLFDKSIRKEDSALRETMKISEYLISQGKLKELSKYTTKELKKESDEKARERTQAMKTRDAIVDILKVTDPEHPQYSFLQEKLGEAWERIIALGWERMRVFDELEIEEEELSDERAREEKARERVQVIKTREIIVDLLKVTSPKDPQYLVWQKKLGEVWERIIALGWERMRVLDELEELELEEEELSDERVQAIETGDIIVDILKVTSPKDPQYPFLREKLGEVWERIIALGWERMRVLDELEEEEASYERTQAMKTRDAIVDILKVTDPEHPQYSFLQEKLGEAWERIIALGWERMRVFDELEEEEKSIVKLIKEIPKEKQEFNEGCRAKGGELSEKYGSDQSMSGLPTQEKGTKCTFKKEQSNCWGFMTYSGSSFSGGDSICDKKNLLPDSLKDALNKGEPSSKSTKQPTAPKTTVPKTTAPAPAPLHDLGQPTGTAAPKIEFTLSQSNFNAKVGEHFSYSFCRPALTRTSDICTASATNPRYGLPPYSFYVESGGFLPFGLTLNLNGLVEGTPTAEGSRTVNICAKDTGGFSVCRGVTINVEANYPYDGHYTAKCSTSCRDNCCISGSIEAGLPESYRETMCISNSTGGEDYYRVTKNILSDNVGGQGTVNASGETQIVRDYHGSHYVTNYKFFSSGGKILVDVIENLTIDDWGYNCTKTCTTKCSGYSDY